MGRLSPDEMLDLASQGLLESMVSNDEFLATSHGYLARDGATSSRWDQSRNGVLNGLNRIRTTEAGKAALHLLLANDIRESRDVTDRAALLDFVSWRAKVVESVPTCDYCSTQSSFEGRTRPAGNWAFMCEAHFRKYGTGLGENQGQRLVTRGSLRGGHDGRNASHFGESDPLSFRYSIADAMIDAEAVGALSEFTVGGPPLTGTDYTGMNAIHVNDDRSVAGAGYYHHDPQGASGIGDDPALSRKNAGLPVRYESLATMKSKVEGILDELHFLVVSLPMSEEKVSLADLHMELVRSHDDLSNLAKVAESHPDDVRLEAAASHFRKMFAEMVDALTFSEYAPGAWSPRADLSE